MAQRQMVHLTSATGSFHAQVVAARLDAEGIPCEFRRVGGWPFPEAGDVRIYVRADDLAIASELLLFDRVDEVFQAG